MRTSKLNEHEQLARQSRWRDESRKHFYPLRAVFFRKSDNLDNRSAAHEVTSFSTQRQT